MESSSAETLAGALAHGTELLGIGVMLIGGLIACGAFLRRLAHRTRRQAGDVGEPHDRSFEPLYRELRANLGRAILLGLEFLVAADIISTVAAEPTFRSLGVLALIVAIRTFLSFTLELDISGRWPWQQHDSSRGPHDAGNTGRPAA